MSRVWLPNTLASGTPDTDSVSSVIALIAASDSWVDLDTWRRRSPTVLVSQKNAGTVTMVESSTTISWATPTTARIIQRRSAGAVGWSRVARGPGEAAGCAM